MNRWLYFLISTTLCFCLTSIAKEAPLLDSSQYLSPLDQDLTIEKVTYLPGKDNVKGIYSKVVDKVVENYIKDNHHWEFVPPFTRESSIEPESLVGHPDLVLSFSKNTGADAILTSEVRKNPSGLELLVFMFSSRSGKLISEERVQKISDDTQAVEKATQGLVGKINRNLPYDGMILSRIDNRVTVNFGTKDGINVGEVFPVFKIISGVRHPKRDFLISTKKAILGQIRIVKADSYLSFADITSEVDFGSIQKAAKVSGKNRSEPEKTQWTDTYTPPEILISENDQPIGAGSKEWVPAQPATFGRLGVRLGLGHFNNNLKLSSGRNQTIKAPLYPKIELEGEMWISSKWFINGHISQGIAFSKNTTGNEPSTLNSTLSLYRITGGYNFLLGQDFFGPRVSIETGISFYNFFMDQASRASLSSITYTSLPIGISAYTPIGANREWGVGGIVYFHLFPSLRTKPYEGEGRNSINQIVIYGVKKWSEILNIRFGLETMVFSSEISEVNSPLTETTQNMSQRHILGLLGIDYFF